MKCSLQKNETKTPKKTALALCKKVSERTARRALKIIGLVSAVKHKKPALSAKNVRARMKFCKIHKDWSVDEWKRVIWSDETKVNRFQCDGKEYFWRRPHE